MSDELGAISDITTGALAARAIEPDAGAAPGAGSVADAGVQGDGHTNEQRCLNCGTPLIGTHCHACGQRAHVHRTLGAFVHDLLHGVLHFEGKIWRTLPLLAWRPGRLTREYIDGKRASYVSPIALFLFVVFVSFAAFNLLGAGAAGNVPGGGLQFAEQAYRDNAARLATLRKEEAALPPAESTRRAEIAGAIAELEDDQRGLRIVVGAREGAVPDSMSGGTTDAPRTKEPDDAEAATLGTLPEDSALARAVQHIRANPQLAIYKAQTNAYKYSWALIPLSVPFVWLLFAFDRRFGVYDHTVFTTYSISFMIALVAVASMLLYVGLGWFGIVLLYAPLHMYRQLRGTYALGRFGAFWRMLALSVMSWVAIALFASMVGLLAA